jgi:tetratricopeptide (TPR) repeat protein
LAKIWLRLIALCQHRGQLDKAIAMAEMALGHLKDKTSPEYCLILAKRGFIVLLKEGGGVQNFDMRAALELARQNGHKVAEGQILGMLSIYHQERGELEEAERCSQKAIAIQREMGDRESLAKLLIGLGTIRRALGQFKESRRALKEALRLTRDTRVEINCHLELGRLLHAEGEIQAAREEIQQALNMVLDTGYVNEQGDCYRELGRLALKADDEKSTRHFYRMAMELYFDYGYKAKVEALEKEIAERLPEWRR